MHVLWLLLGCGSEPDADRYYRLTTGSGDPRQRIAECTRLTSPTMQSDCQLTVAHQSEAMAELCTELIEPVWRSECYFMAAERLKITDPEQAGVLCLKAEHFQNQCIQHLWQSELLSLTRHGSRAFPVAVPKAVALYTQWESLSKDSDMAVRFWRLFYMSGFRRARFLSPSHCSPLSGEHQTRCREAAATLYTQQLRQIVRIPRAMSVFCALDPLDSTAASQTRVPELRAEPALELDAVVVSVHEQLCEGSRPREDATEIRLPGFEEE